MRALAALVLLVCFPVSFLVGFLIDSDAGRDANGLLWIYLAAIIVAAAITALIALSSSVLSVSRGTILVSTLVSAMVVSGLLWAGWVAGYSLSDGYLCGDGDCNQPITYIAIWMFATVLTAIPVTALGFLAAWIVMTRVPDTFRPAND